MATHLHSDLSKVGFHDKSVTKVTERSAPHGELGQKYLAAGIKLGMRLWEEKAPLSGHESERDYEVVGYVLEGKAELHIEGQMILLEKGDSWVVPKGSRHRYRILTPFRAVEATSPPAFVKNRDHPTEEGHAEKHSGIGKDVSSRT